MGQWDSEKTSLFPAAVIAVTVLSVPLFATVCTMVFPVLKVLLLSSTLGIILGIALVVMLDLLCVWYFDVAAVGWAGLLCMLNCGLRKICHHICRWLPVLLGIVGILATSINSIRIQSIFDPAEPGIPRTAVEVVVSLILVLAIVAFTLLG